MPLYTKFFGVAYFQLNDNLADLNNVTAEMNRFTIIDNQLYGLYSIFGSGVISGWQVQNPSVQSPNNITINITAGMGIVNYYAAETLFDTLLSGLPANQTLYIFAQTTGLTATTSAVSFIYSQSLYVSQSVLLAVVITSNNGIVSIDTSVATQIGFQAVIDQEIAKHHHRGTPTKIDLATETKGQLPGNKFGNVSASVVQQGKFSPQRLPVIDHDSLENVGLFTHIELDAMARKLKGTEGQQLGEISLSNQLREILYLKYRFEDIDQDFLNEFAFIPGISPDSMIDYTATTASINEASNCIGGRPVQNGQIVSVLWNTAASFNTGASELVNCDVGMGGVTISRGDVNTQLVEGFDEGAAGNTLSAFTVSLVAVDSQTGVYADPTLAVNAAYSGRFQINQTNRAIFTKTLNPPQDWRSWDLLTLWIKCSTTTHGAVWMYLNSSGGQSTTIQLLAENEVTTNPTLAYEGFEQRTMVIDSFGTRDSVTQIIIYADDIDEEFEFWVDDIILQRNQQYLPQGTIRLRYNTTETVVFNSLTYTSTLPTGTQVKAHIRVADNETDLATTLFSNFLSSADTFVLRGRWAEVEVQLFSNALFTQTPVLTSVEIGLLVNATNDGFTVETAEQWAAGTSSNLDFIGTVNQTAQIRFPVTVGDIVSMNNGAVSEITQAGVPVFGVGGSGLPPSEFEAYNALEGLGLQAGLYDPVSVVRTNDRRYIVCDTGNSRIIIYDHSGHVLNIYAGANQDTVQNVPQVFGLTATYNQATGILWLGFSMTATISPTLLDLVKMNIGATQINFGEEGQTFTGQIIGRVVGIPLTTDHQALLANVTEQVTVQYGAGFMSNFSDIYVDVPITVYFAPIAYYPYIFNPIYATPSNNGNLWICNATELPLTAAASGNLVTPIAPTTRNLQQFSPTADLNVWTNSVNFLLAYPGSILELPNGTIYVAGCDSNRNGVVTANPMTGSPQTIYTSPFNNFPTSIAMDANGYLWIAEASGTVRGGRLVKIDTLGNIQNVIDGVFTKIHSVQVLNDGNLLVGC